MQLFKFIVVKVCLFVCLGGGFGDSFSCLFGLNILKYAFLFSRNCKGEFYCLVWISGDHLVGERCRVVFFKHFYYAQIVRVNVLNTPWVCLISFEFMKEIKAQYC